MGRIKDLDFGCGYIVGQCGLHLRINAAVLAATTDMFGMLWWRLENEILKPWNKFKDEQYSRFNSIVYMWKLKMW